MNMKKIGIAIATVLLVFAVFVTSVFASDNDNYVVAPLSADQFSAGDLYSGGFMNEVLTHRNPAPWNLVKHYVGNKPACIVKILKEQGISLDPTVKYPVGMAVAIPQKYVLKELLPTPSAAEAALQEAELKGDAIQLQHKLEVKDNEISGHWIFHVLSAIILAVLIGLLMNRHNKYVGANATANSYKKNLKLVFRREIKVLKELDAVEKRHQNYVMFANGEKSALLLQLAAADKRCQETEKLLDAVVSRQVGQMLSFEDNNGVRHAVIIKRHEWDSEKKAAVVWVRCGYCDTETHDNREDVLKHISRSHPEKMNPDPKRKPQPLTLKITTEALVSE